MGRSDAFRKRAPDACPLSSTIRTLVCDRFMNDPPPTMVSTARPVTVQPSKGVLRLRLKNRVLSTVQVRLRSITVRSAGRPSISPQGKLRMRAGLTVSREIRSVNDNRPSVTSCKASGRAVSKPMMPLAAWSNATSFSRVVCGHGP